jgi:hypothetical protein
MITLRIGDKVLIKNKKEMIKDTTLSFNEVMESFSGHLMTVGLVDNSRRGFTLYRMLEDSGKWGWCSYMFEVPRHSQLLYISVYEVNSDVR